MYLSFDYLLTFFFYVLGGVSIEGDNDSWDFGTGAGFYLDATESKWSKNYRMYSYIVKELPSIVNSQLPIVSYFFLKKNA
jgi:S-formylglutathione hydrolase FrmB